MQAKQDVIIVGAGPGGSATAHFLAQHGLRVLLLDKATFPRDKTCGDGLTPRAVGVLQSLGILEDLRRRVAFQMDEATLFSPNGRPITTQMPQRDDLPNYMLTIPRLELDEAIRQRAVASGAAFMGGVHVSNIEQLGDGVKVVGKREKRPFSATATMVVIAVGASVRLLKTIGLLQETPKMILAARAYYEGLQGMNGRFEFHFDGIPLPGYGWIFPLSETSGNVGAGTLPVRRWPWQRQPQATSGKAVLEQFSQTPHMRHVLAHAKRVGPVKGFPLRTDFATAPTFGERLFLVGEAAGLVNPLTGEGVDYALESAEIAAEQLIMQFAQGDFSLKMGSLYDQKLRDKFQRLFVFSSRMRDYYLHRPVINRLVDVAHKRDELRALFTDVVLGNTDAAQALSPRTLWQIVTTR